MQVGGSWDLAIALAATLAGCATAPSQAAPTHAAAVAPAASEPLLAPRIVANVGFDRPESVVYDAASDRYLVSNIVGSAAARDDRAFISRIRPDGTVEVLRWIDSERPEVELHAPKGLALAAGVLYVADIDRVRKFDRSTGRALGSVALPSASFLHDVTVAADGALYVSDSGLGEGLSPTGKDAIYRVAADGTTRVVASSRELGQPSGLWASAEGLWVASFGSGELYLLDERGQRRAVEKLPKGSLDGVVVDGPRVFVSSWEGAAVYERSGGKFVERLTGLHAAADLALDTRRHRLLVTHYEQNALSIHQL